MNYKYELRAHNKQGVTVCFEGISHADVLYQFDMNYYRAGWKIVIFNRNINEIVKEVKRTFR